MGNAKSVLAYADVQETLDKALASPKGVSIKFDSRGQAIRFRHRAYALRKKLREESVNIYEPGEFMHGRTAYDALSFPDPEPVGERFMLKIGKGSIEQLEIEEL